MKAGGGYLCLVLDWLSRRVVRFPDGRGNPAAFWWWCGHAVALLALTYVTLIRGAGTRWFWIIGAALSVSCYAGQYVIERRAWKRRPRP